MASLIPPGLDTIIQERILQILIAKNAEQKGIDPLVAYFPKKNIMDSIDQEEPMPLVNIWVKSIIPTVSANTYVQETVIYNIDMYAKGKSEDPNISNAQIAMERLDYLKQQVKNPLLALINIDFGLEAGLISKKKNPRYESFSPEISYSENSLVAGRWVFEVEYSYSPDDIDLNDLSIINVIETLWKAFFQY